MENLHQYAIYIELKVRTLLGKDIERFALGGIVNSDFIEYGGMITAIAAGLATKYSNENRERIDKFLDEIVEYNGVNFADIEKSKIVEINEKLKELIESLN